MDKSKTEALENLLASPRKTLIVPHKNPDGDALGSTLAMCLLLKAEGHDCVVVSPNSYPDFLKWLPGENGIVNFEKEKEKAEKLIAEAEIIFTLDFNMLSRAGDLEKPLEKSTAKFVMIDHHEQPGDYADFVESEPGMSSTAEMVYHFLKKTKRSEAITPEIATCLYTGIMTDTGSFKYSSTTDITHLVVADLLKRGAKNSEIHAAVYDTNSFDRLQLLGQALRNLKTEEEYRTAYITLSQEEQDKHHFKKGDTEGFVNYALSLKGTVLAAIFIEDKKEKIIKISLRSKGDFDVNQFARKHYNGGGHRNAAGGRSEKNLQETVKEFINILQGYKNDLGRKDLSPALPAGRRKTLSV